MATVSAWLIKRLILLGRPIGQCSHNWLSPPLMPAPAFNFSQREFEMTEDQSEIHDKKRQKVTINEPRTLLDFRKSKRLSEMGERSGKRIQSSPTPCRKISPSESEDEASIHLAIARELIDRKINELMNRLPEDKKNKLFRLRYGTVDGIKSMAISEAFRRLAIDGKGVKLRMLAGMNYYGRTEKEPAGS